MVDITMDIPVGVGEQVFRLVLIIFMILGMAITPLVMAIIAICITVAFLMVITVHTNLGAVIIMVGAVILITIIGNDL
jgi:hypothetical protein